MDRRKVKLHIGGGDPWIDIRRSGQGPQNEPYEDWVTTVVGIVLLVVFLAWLFS